MNGIARFVLAGGLIVAASQMVAGPLADWNARREGAAVRFSIVVLYLLRYSGCWLLAMAPLFKAERFGGAIMCV